MRTTPAMRAASRDVFLNPENFIQPVFVHTGTSDQPVESMPGVSRIALKNTGDWLKKVEDLGIPSILVFPLPEDNEKDAVGRVCRTTNGSPARILGTLKEKSSRLNVMTDLCLCPFTTHGHCGILHDHSVQNDETLSALAESAVTLARAGADWVAPSGMMDGMVGAIRTGLDQADLGQTAILSYSIKFASAFYGPFRDAAHSAPEFGDRSQYQMDFRSAGQIGRELRLDLDEGADAVMVKPALPYLDVIRQCKETADVPVAAYQVSGEYSMLHAAAQKGWMDLHRAFEETLVAIRRAGADWIISYYAMEFLSRRR